MNQRHTVGLDPLNTGTLMTQLTATGLRGCALKRIYEQHRRVTYLSFVCLSCSFIEAVSSLA